MSLKETVAQLKEMWQYAFKPLRLEEDVDEIFRVLLARQFYLLLMILIMVILIIALAIFG